MEMDSKKRLIITSVISIVLVSILMIGSTYSIFNSTDIDEEANVYQTGNLSVSLKSDENVTLDSSIPISSEEEVGKLTPYRVTVTNNGTVPYKFNVILTPTTATSEIDHQFVMVKVGKLEAKPFDSCTNNIIKEDIILLPNKSVNIDIRIYISDKIKNTEVDKNFSAKIKVDGVGAYSDNDEVDNSILEYPAPVLLSSVPAGSYVKYTGNNGCSRYNCMGDNANYTNEGNMGYCNNSAHQFLRNGWRVAYSKDGSAYLVSGGAPECIGSNYSQLITTGVSVDVKDRYYYGSGYTFNPSTGVYSLTGVYSSTLLWYSDSTTAIDSYPYTCQSTSSTGTCTTMYKMTGSVGYENGTADKYTVNSSPSSDDHVNNLNIAALKYCNSTYAYGGVCNGSSAWNIQDSDFKIITGITLSEAYSGTSYNDNDVLINNGGYYWFSTVRNSSPPTLAFCKSESQIFTSSSSEDYGLRPILRLKASIIVTGGTGTYADPYTIE